MAVQEYNIPRHNTKTTFSGVIFNLPAQLNYDLTGASARIDFIKKGTKPVALRLKTSNNTLEISLQYSIVIPETYITLQPGVYKWDLKITFSDGRIKTYIGGEWIIDDVITG